MSPIINALSIDVEDWFQVGAFETTIKRTDWPQCAVRVERNTDALLDLFARLNVKATFFTLGWVAERHPKLISRIVAGGHELASHGYDHARVFTFTPEQFRADLRKSRVLLEQAGAVPVRGYRAPSFSIDARTPWAHAILAEEGYSYSSSVAPVRHDHYGWPEAPRFAYRPLADSPLIELPVTTARAMGRTIAAGGGGFFRLMPYAFTRWAVAQVNQRDQRPAIFYFHPWEIDPHQPHVENAPMRSRLRHYTNLSTTAAKLERLIGGFRWGRMDEILADQAKQAPCWPT